MSVRHLNSGFWFFRVLTSLLYPSDLWTGKVYLNPCHVNTTPLNNGFLLMVLRLSCPYYLWTDKSITQFSFPLSGPEVLSVKLIRLPLNSKLRVWCLLVGHVYFTSEPMGAQIQFTLAVPSGLAVKLIQLSLTADSKFSVLVYHVYATSE